MLSQQHWQYSSVIMTMIMIEVDDDHDNDRWYIFIFVKGKFWCDNFKLIITSELFILLL